MPTVHKRARLLKLGMPEDLTPRSDPELYAAYERLASRKKETWLFEHRHALRGTQAWKDWDAARSALQDEYKALKDPCEIAKLARRIGAVVELKAEVRALELALWKTPEFVKVDEAEKAYDEKF